VAAFDLLCRALHQGPFPPPADLHAAIEALPAAGALPSPWETWTLIGLVRHRRRQLWVGEVITTRLNGSMDRLGRMGALGQPQDRPHGGTVPGLPVWEYYFHGKGCCLTHKITGEAIDVDFFSDSAEYFDLFFYQNYLKSLRDPEPPEWRLLELHASVSAIRLAVESLLTAGALVPLPGRDSHPFRIADAMLGHEADIDSFCAAWADAARRPWLAALVGDWLAAHEEAVRAGDPTLAALTVGRAEQCRHQRRQRLLQARRKEELARDALHGLADLGGEGLDTALSEALRGPLGGVTSAALEVIVKRDDAAWCREVHRLFRRTTPDAPPPQPHLWMAALKFLLRHDHRQQEVLAALSRAGGCEMGEAVLLALEHAPHLALPLIRRALCSKVPANRCAVAAVLALIDRPWSRRELIAALEASDEQEQTADCRAALLECRDEQGHRAVHDWEQRNPHEPETPSFLEIEGRRVGPFHSFGELFCQVSYRAQFIRYEMEQLHDRVMPLRGHEPPPQPP
jgi:hypothetical protein